jgi:hypothetical protein
MLVRTDARGSWLAACALPLALAACSGNIGEPSAGTPGPGPVIGPTGGGGSTGTPDAGTATPPPPPPPPPRPFVPGPPVVRRLLATEYLASIEDLLGPAARAAASAPADSSLNGFLALGAAQLSTGDAQVRVYEASAAAVAEAAVADGLARRAWTSCQPLSVDAPDCFYEFVARFGRRVFRRSPTDQELERWVAAGREAAVRTESFDGGLRWVIAGMLQSPHFLYRVELGAPGAPDAARRLDPFELASRLAFFLTGVGPDDLLLSAAERGELEDPAVVRAHAERLIDTARGRASVRAFFGELLRLRDLDGVVKNHEQFPMFGPELVASMREETLRLVDDIVWTRDADLRELFTADYTFVDDRLAELYGMPTRRQGFRRVDLDPAGARVGVLGHASLMSLLSHAVTTSPTLRGKFVQETLLCQAIPAPPPGVITELPTDEPGEAPRTMRERLAQHQEDPACAACHVLMDGIGLGLESFDPVGRYRERENGRLIDVRGDLVGRPFDGPRGLAQALAGERRAMTCLVRNLYRHATGHLESAGEYPEIERIDRAFEASGFRLQALMVELAASVAFSTVKG